MSDSAVDMTLLRYGLAIAVAELEAPRAEMSVPERAAPGVRPPLPARAMRYERQMIGLVTGMVR
jgi:hypothetical protein